MDRPFKSPLTVAWPVGELPEHRLAATTPEGWYVAQGWDEEYVVNGRRAVHPGLDLNRRDGQDFREPVYAVADGVVVAAQSYAVWGNIVLIHHEAEGGELWSQYAHLDHMSVAAGDAVSLGDKVGVIGMGDGNRYLPHLHFELRRSQLPPQYWPAMRHDIVRAHYVDPIKAFGRSV